MPATETGQAPRESLPMHDTATALAHIRERIRECERRYGRVPGSVSLLAVSKTKPVAAVRAAWEAGQRDFGENQLQDALTKIEPLAGLDICWHFIGPVQSNKTRAVAANFHWVQSIDRLKIATRLNDQRDASAPPLNICIQVNISGEASKSGVEPAQVEALARAVMLLPRLRLRGLMAIPAPCHGLQAQRAGLRPLREIHERLRAAGLALDTLSMGMSDDMEAAIAEGSTMVRIGTALFGAREPAGHAPEAAPPG